MFGHSPSPNPVLYLAEFPLEHVAIAVLGAAVAVLVLLLVALRSRATIRIGPISIEPAGNGRPAEAEPESTGAYVSPLTPEPTEPFNLAEINAAMRASETMRAIEALRAMETRLADESKRKASAMPVLPVVRSFVMRVCPLCVLYEVSGSSPRCHIIPSDMRQVNIGRAPDNDIRSNQPNVSQHHFRLVIAPQSAGEGEIGYYSVEVQDRDSKNGTWVNGKRIDSDVRVVLQDGDIVEAASSRYLFYHVFRGESP